MVQIVEIKDNPLWEYDVDKAIDDFEAEFGIEPHICIGKNFIEMITASTMFIHREQPIDAVMKYKGVPCEYNPNISYVILKA